MISAIEKNPKHLSKTTSHLQKLKARRDAILSGEPMPKDEPEILESQVSPNQQEEQSDWDWKPNTIISTEYQYPLFQTSSLETSLKLPVMNAKPILPPISQLMSILN